MSNPATRGEAANDVLDALTRSLGDLTPELRKAATHVLEHASLISVTSIREMAEGADVKPNTLVRMARALGFEGYEDFRRPFREQVINGTDQFPDRARWLQSLSKGGKLSGLYTEMATSSIGNIERVFSETTARAIKGAADEIIKAPRTYVLGVGIMQSAATSFAYLTNMAIGRVIVIPRDGHSPSDGLARVDKKDVLLALTFKPYVREVAEAVSVAVSRGVKVISISDSPAAPIMARATYRFVVPTESPQFFPSTVALISLLETIAAFVVAEGGAEIVANIEELQRRRHEMGLFWDDDDRD